MKQSALRPQELGPRENFPFSTRPNPEGGGKRWTRRHYDVPMRDRTVILDNNVVIDEGSLVGGKMRVTLVRH